MGQGGQLLGSTYRDWVAPGSLSAEDEMRGRAEAAGRWEEGCAGRQNRWEGNLGVTNPGQGKGLLGGDHDQC